MLIRYTGRLLQKGAVTDPRTGFPTRAPPWPCAGGSLRRYREATGGQHAGGFDPGFRSRRFDRQRISETFITPAQQRSAAENTEAEATSSEGVAPVW